ncbi:MAG: tol-pal system protein YbgF [Thiolinea sp.]
MSGKVSRGLLAVSIALSVSVIPAAQAVSDDVALQLLERLGELEKEVSGLRGENEMLRNELQGIKTIQREGFLEVDERVSGLEKSGSETGQPAVAADVVATDNGDMSGSELPALEDPVIPSVVPSVVPSVEPPPVTVEMSTDEPSLSDPEDRKAIAPAVEFNAAASTEKVDPKSPDSYYYYGTEDRNQPDVRANTLSPQDNDAGMTDSDPEAVTAQPASSKIPDTHQAKAEYNEAYKALVNDPRTAVPAFRAFLSKYPDHELAANAQYWLGEALYAQKDYSGASEEFMVVLKQHKNSAKAPGAALKLGYSFYELRQWDFARRTLEDTVRFFPDSNAATLAKQRLEKMTAEGH